MEIWVLWVLAALLVTAVAFDVGSHRIPNAVVAVGLLGGVAAQTAVTGWHGLADAVTGAALGLVLLLPFHLMGGMGAGDVKLMAAVGAFLGPFHTLIAAALTLVIGAIMAVFVLAFRRGLRSSAGQLRELGLSLAMTRRPSVVETGSQAIRFTYAPAIALGTAVSLLLMLRT